MSVLFGLFSAFLTIIFVIAALYVLIKILSEVGEFVFWIFVAGIVFFISYSVILYLVGAASDMF